MTNLTTTFQCPYRVSSVGSSVDLIHRFAFLFQLVEQGPLLTKAYLTNAWRRFEQLFSIVQNLSASPLSKGIFQRSRQLLYSDSHVPEAPQSRKFYHLYTYLFGVHRHNQRRGNLLSAPKVLCRVSLRLPIRVVCDIQECLMDFWQLLHKKLSPHQLAQLCSLRMRYLPPWLVITWVWLLLIKSWVMVISTTDWRQRLLSGEVNCNNR